MKQSPTNELTQRILHFFYDHKIFAWRSNTSGMPVRSGGVITGLRPSGKTGVPDVLAILPPYGRFLGVEIKTGKDRLRPEQIGFHESARSCGAACITVKTWEDFLQQFNSVV